MGNRRGDVGWGTIDTGTTITGGRRNQCKYRRKSNMICYNLKSSQYAYKCSSECLKHCEFFIEKQYTTHEH